MMNISSGIQPRYSWPVVWFSRLLALTLLPMLLLAWLTSAAPALADTTSTVVNFDTAGHQVIRPDTAGNAIDAHDGGISQFGNAYYFYGTAYNCGYVWQQVGTPFCGFNVYSSTDLVHWTNHGTVFDATTTTWQSRCGVNGNVSVQGNCFRPHILYNSKTKEYVLWVKDYTASYHFRVFYSTSPIGPFTEQAVPTLAITNAGDEDVFQDTDGTGYIIYTDRNSHYDLAIEKLNANYTSGTGSFIRLGLTTVEAPTLFKRNSTYYVQYSTPNCGYCGGTGTAYKTATTPLGTWSAGVTITTTSCGGQPTHVTPIATSGGTTYLYQSDLWNKGAHNEALANYFWGSLSFNADGSIQNLVCSATYPLTLTGGQAGSQDPIPGVDQQDGVAGFRPLCDVANAVRRLQTFTPAQSGTLTGATLTTFQTGKPNASVNLDIVSVNAQGQPTATLSAHSIAAAQIGWSARDVTITPNIAVTAGQTYGILLHSAATTGCYGIAYNDDNIYTRGQELYSSNGGNSFTVESQRALKFVTQLNSSSQKNLALGATPSATSSYENSGWGLAKVNDGQITSTTTSKGWSSNNTLASNHTESIQLDLGAAMPLNQIVLDPRTDSPNLGQGFPIDFTVAVSNDGTTWTTVVTQTGGTLPTAAQTYSFAPQNARYVRVQGTTLRVNPNDSNHYRMQFAEIELY